MENKYFVKRSIILSVNIDMYDFDLPFNDRVQWAAYKAQTTGKAGVYVPIEQITLVVSSIMQSGYARNVGDYFFLLCAIIAKSFNNKQVHQYAIVFQSNDVAKISNIKMFRAIVGSQIFCNIFNHRFPDGLKECKEMVEADIAIGPVSYEQTEQLIELAKEKMGYSAAYQPMFAIKPVNNSSSIKLIEKVYKQFLPC